MMTETPLNKPNKTMLKKSHYNRDLTKKLLELNKYERKPNRYNVSELYGLLNGYPQTKPTIQDIIRMANGTMKHKWLEQFAEGQTEVKKEIDYDDFVLVGKCDELLDNAVVEYKTSDKVMDKAKPWAVFQVRMYLSMFERPLGIIYQPVIKNNKFILKCLGTTHRNDDWYAEQIDKLKQYVKGFSSMGQKDQK